MAKYLLLKHYRGAPAPVNDVPMDQWRPDEVEAHIRFMNDFAARLESSGEFIDGQALSSTYGIDKVTGLINVERPEQSEKNDWFGLCSVGPFLNMQPGEVIQVDVALAVQKLDYTKPIDDPGDASRPNVARYQERATTFGRQIPIVVIEPREPVRLSPRA